MPGQRQPIELIKANGKSHFTKKQMEEREKNQVFAKSDDVVPPLFLPEKFHDKFNYLAGELKEIGIIGNIDNETLARYIMSQDAYEKVSLKMFKMGVLNPKYDSLLSKQFKLFEMCRKCSSELGLSISSRCKLAVPKKEEKPKNKFDRFLANEG
ncbi:MAG: phage terminase small subunit P27 family [Sarcina sp.]